MNKYDDILNLPHHRSKTHPHMSISDRAAQFAPFAALTGYGDAVRETARLTDEKMELDADALADLDETLGEIARRLPQSSKVRICYFSKDAKKAGGQYITETFVIKKIDPYAKKIVTENGESIPIEDIAELSLED